MDIKRITTDLGKIHATILEERYKGLTREQIAQKQEARIRQLEAKLRMHDASSDGITENGTYDEGWYEFHNG